MTSSKSTVLWVLRIGVAGEFFGHGVLALQGKETWLTWISQMLEVGRPTAETLLMAIGILDIVTALVVLIAPMPAFVLWAALWGFWTAMVRPLVGEPVWDFVERWANWAAPLALLLLSPWPKSLREWFHPQR